MKTLDGWPNKTSASDGAAKDKTVGDMGEPHYPWRNWLVRKHLVLTKGEDFDGDTERFVKLLRRKIAAVYGKGAHFAISKDGNTVFCVVP